MVWKNSEGKKFIVIPRVKLGNIILLPQPLKGESHTTSAANKIAHDRKIPPPHNYLATYFWLEEGYKTDAIVHFGSHGTEWLFPGKPDVMSGSDWTDILISNMPNINPWMANNTGEVTSCRRRAMATIISLLPPPLFDAGLSNELLNIETNVLKYYEMDEGPLKAKFTERITKQVEELKIEKDLGYKIENNDVLTSDQINEVFMYIHDLKNEVVPSSLHVMGEQPSEELLVPYLVYCMGKAYLNHSKEIYKPAPNIHLEEEYLKDKAQKVIRNILYKKQSIYDALISSGAKLQNDSIPSLIQKKIEKTIVLSKGLARSHEEIDNILEAFNGNFVPPGPSGKPERNPDVVPGGRNMYIMNSDELPSKPSWEIGSKLIKDYLDNFYAENNRYPSKVGFSLIPFATYEDHGIIESQILYLIGARPVWDERNQVNDVEIIPTEELGRPRIDVFLSTRSVYRDQLPSRMLLLDKALRKIASIKEKDNYVYEHTEKSRIALEEQGVASETADALAKARMFGWPLGEVSDSWFYHLIERSGEWDKKEEALGVYLNQCKHVYTETMWGIESPQAYDLAIQGTELILRSWHDSRNSPVADKYGWWVDGTLSLAVKHLTGKEPEFKFVDVRDMDDIGMVDAKTAIQKDLRARVFNPRWINSMKNDGYAGADIIAKNVENIMGWKVMRDKSITDDNLEEVYNVFVKDSKNLQIREWLDDTNPYAFQKMSEVLLETIRKGMWSPSKEISEDIAKEYAKSVAKFGKVGGIREGNNSKLKDFVEENLQAPGNSTILNSYKQKSAEMDKPIDESNAKNELVKGKKFVKQENQKVKKELPVNISIAFGIMAAALFIIIIGFLKGGKKWNM
jgi:cobaltochelatase CobN